MESKILYQPSYSLAELKLKQGESITAESGAMVSMSGNIKVDTGLQSGGVWGALKRTVLGGESFFVNTFTAEGSDGEVTLAPALSGDIVNRQLNNETMFVQSGSFLASEKSIDVDTKWGGGKTFFSGEGFFLLKVSGSGHLFLSSYGAIHEIALADGQNYIVDTGHIVAFDESVQYEVKGMGNWKSTILSGEGLVVSLTGPGRIYIQTRSFQAFMNYLVPKLPKTGSNN